MNMALDEALLESMAKAGCDSAILRLYQWARPTLSLGYFQRAVEREGHGPSRNCDLIRRPSGGGAILHDRELTYSLALPAVIAKTRPATQWYLDVHHALIAAIGELTSAQATLCDNPTRLPANQEPFLCFQRRASGDVLYGEHKIAGSAQRRQRDAILQHGSVLLQHSQHAPQLPGIVDLTTAKLDLESLAQSFTHEIATGLELSLQASLPSDVENVTAEQLQSEKYGDEGWTLRR